MSFSLPLWDSSRFSNSAWCTASALSSESPRPLSIALFASLSCALHQQARLAWSWDNTRAWLSQPSGWDSPTELLRPWSSLAPWAAYRSSCSCDSRPLASSFARATCTPGRQGRCASWHTPQMLSGPLQTWPNLSFLTHLAYHKCPGGCLRTLTSASSSILSLLINLQSIAD